jgi:hypothetical protein
MEQEDIYIQQTIQTISQDSAGVRVEHAENVYISVNEQPKKQLSNGWQIEPPEKIEHIESAELISLIVKLDEVGEIQNKNEILNLFYDITIYAKDKSPKIFAKIEEPNAPDIEYAKAVGAEKKRLKQVLDRREFVLKEFNLLTNILSQKECLLFGSDGFDTETTALHILEFLCSDYSDNHVAQTKKFTLSFYSKNDEPQENDIKIKTSIEEGYFLELLKEHLGMPHNIDFQDTPHEVRVVFYANMIKQYIRQKEHKLSLAQYFDMWSNKKWVSLD